MVLEIVDSFRLTYLTVKVSSGLWTFVNRFLGGEREYVLELGRWLTVGSVDLWLADSHWRKRPLTVLCIRHPGLRGCCLFQLLLQLGFRFANCLFTPLPPWVALSQSFSDRGNGSPGFWFLAIPFLCALASSFVCSPFPGISNSFNGYKHKPEPDLWGRKRGLC